MRWTSGQNLCLVLTEKRNKSFSGHFLKYWADILLTSYELAKEADIYLSLVEFTFHFLSEKNEERRYRRWFKTIVLKISNMSLLKNGN